MKCLFCMKQETSTETVVKINEIDYKISLCDEHAETSTIAAIKQKVQEICKQLEEITTLAKEVGIIRENTTQGIATNRQTPQIQKEETPKSKFLRPGGRGGHAPELISITNAAGEVIKGKEDIDIIKPSKLPAIGEYSSRADGGDDYAYSVGS